jgi:hypothetical protein
MQTIAQWEQYGKKNYSQSNEFDDPFVGRGPKESIALLKPKLQAALQNPGQGTPQNNTGYDGGYAQNLGGSESPGLYGGGQSFGGSGPPSSRYGGGFGGPEGPGSLGDGRYGGSAGYDSSRW